MPRIPGFEGNAFIPQLQVAYRKQSWLETFYVSRLSLCGFALHRGPLPLRAQRRPIHPPRAALTFRLAPCQHPKITPAELKSALSSCPHCTHLNTACQGRFSAAWCSLGVRPMDPSPPLLGPWNQDNGYRIRSNPLLRQRSQILCSCLLHLCCRSLSLASLIRLDQRMPPIQGFHACVLRLLHYFSITSCRLKFPCGL
jgi:hypothetical protein